MPLSNPWYFLGELLLTDRRWRTFETVSIYGGTIVIEGDPQDGLSYEADDVRTKLFVRRRWGLSGGKLVTEPAKVIYFGRDSKAKVFELPSSIRDESLGLIVSDIQVALSYNYPGLVATDSTLFTNLRRIHPIVIRGYEG